MDSDLDLRLKTDRLFVEYLCETTGKSASALATGAGMAPTTLNRFLSKKVKLQSSLKDTTIQRIAAKWGFDHLELLGYRKKIEESLRTGKSLPDIHKMRAKALASTGAFREPRSKLFDTPERDPLMDDIMGATYDTWFNGDHQDKVPFERLPDLVRLLYGRARVEPKPPNAAEIKKRAADMLAVAAMETGGKRK
jgi:transcriptional regulator with XRE-family HTH domain